MQITVQTKGVQSLLRKIDRLQKGYSRGVERGVYKAGLFLQRESQKIVPVLTGNLRLSAFTRKEGKGTGTQVRVGYTANYAVFVHENLTARHKPGKQAKFLETPAREKRDEIAAIIANEIRQSV